MPTGTASAVDVPHLRLICWSSALRAILTSASGAEIGRVYRSSEVGPEGGRNSRSSFPSGPGNAVVVTRIISFIARACYAGPTMNDRPNSYAKLLDDIRARVRTACRDMPEFEFGALTARMAEIEMKYRQREIFVAVETEARRLTPPDPLPAGPVEASPAQESLA
jgi:hypothetical protein